MALIVKVFVWEYHINLRTFEDYINDHVSKTIPGERILSFWVKLLVSSGLIETMPGVGK